MELRTGIAEHHSQQHQPRGERSAAVKAGEQNKQPFCKTDDSNIFLGMLQRYKTIKHRERAYKQAQQ
jgi:hypothetical protein